MPKAWGAGGGKGSAMELCHGNETGIPGGAPCGGGTQGWNQKACPLDKLCFRSSEGS